VEQAEQGDEESQAILLEYSAQFIKNGNKKDGLLLLRILAQSKGDNVPKAALNLLKDLDPKQKYGYY
jgi:hypothetical protein